MGDLSEDNGLGDMPGADGEPGDPAAEGTESEIAASEEGASGGESAADPGFGDGGEGSDSLPSMTDDEPSAGGAGRVAQTSDMQGNPGSGSAAGGRGQSTGDASGSGGMAGAAGMPSGSESGEGAGGTGSQAGGGLPGGIPGNSAGFPSGGIPGGVPGGFPGGVPGGIVGGIPGGQGTLTRAEQVAILDAELERGAGEFDSMILEEQTAARESAREQGDPRSNREAGSGSGGGTGSAEEQGGYGREIAGAGGYGAGGGMGGGSRRDQIPENTAKYPAPDDIPDGKNDDVVARQLREAAMREPDPAVRERLWAEYRKYKGIDQP